MIKTLIIVLLIGSLAYCDQSQDRQELVQTLQRLKTSKLGGDVFTALLLEMETNTNTQSVERINELLQNMYDDFRQLRDEVFTQKSNKYAFCVTKLHELEEQLATYDINLAQARTRIPALQEQQAEKQQQQSEKEEELTLNGQAIKQILEEQILYSRVHEENVAGEQAYEQSIQNHNDMIGALNQAKALIEQLAATSFLQKSVFSETALLQIQTIDQKLNLKHHKGLIKVLMQMAQNQEIQADQDSVSHIITIIDELVGYENDAKQQEGRNEQNRIYRFEEDVARLEAAATYLQNDIQSLVSDVIVLGRRITELEQDIVDYTGLIADKQEQTQLQNRDCDDDLRVLEGRVDEYNEIIDLIRAVMRLFRTFTLQNLRDVFAELN